MEETQNAGATAQSDSVAELLNERRTQQQIRDADPDRIETVADHLKLASGAPKGPIGAKGSMVPRAWRPGITPEQKKKRNAKRKAQKQARKRNR